MRCPSSRLLAVALALAGGCTNVVRVPPVPAGEGVTVVLVDYGRHASLVLPDATAGSYTEYAYGEWSWFALDRTAWYDVFPTLFWPTRGALGRRRVSWMDETAPAEAFICETAFAIGVRRGAWADVAADLDDQFRRHADTAHYQSVHDLVFVHHDDRYDLLNNSNHAVVRWLESLGCRVDGPGLLSRFDVRPLDGAEAGPGGDDMSVIPDDATRNDAIRLARSFPVPVERLFAAWCDADVFRRWAWGSLGHDTGATVDCRVGGAYRVSTRRPDGSEWAFSGEFLECVPDERLVLTVTWEQPMGYDSPGETVEATFAGEGSGSALDFVHRGVRLEAAREEHRRGWENVLDTLGRGHPDR
ncbi:MAG: SRPBCC family protein [Planctomycetota bacterium]|jgi:uncharacterized protein YndB with AHSA1/START domain